MNRVTSAFSDTIAGYVTGFDRAADSFGIKAPGGQDFRIGFAPNTYAQVIRNLDQPYEDCTGQMRDLLTPGRFVFAYGIFYPESDGFECDAQFLLFPGRHGEEFLFEKPNWWTQQVVSIADFYLKAQFGNNPVDYRNYRTTITLSGEKPADHYRQETDTISRLVYGFATAYLMTGHDRFLEAAEHGTEYLREHMRFYDADENVVYWYHGIDVCGRQESKVFASEFGDDFDAIPAYEQIYALAGPIQTYRITGDPRILHDAELTVDLFDRFYLDRRQGGYFSHLDPINLDPHSDSLGPNKGKKNWNSIGDHAPAYLINLFLATGETRYARFLEHTFDLIGAHFPDYANSPFVRERFYEDWTPDTTHLWQQNRGVVGHNLKIAWNLMRMYSLKQKAQYEAQARTIAELMPSAGMDLQRGGWYDVIERELKDGQRSRRFSFHDRKAWWQQEQGILAYLILHGVLGDAQYLKHARESAAFYNAFFLDHDDGAVYFNVLANGIPYLMGTERFKGSHSMSAYHSTELCYLAAVYTNLLITKQPLDLFFKPHSGGFKRNVLRVSPDMLPAGSVRIGEVWANDEKYTRFDAERLIVSLPDTKEVIRYRVRLVPQSGQM